ncbi:hypothetical protein K3495_g6601 [Podosphaera aphanis]|nr:hypothetical protein K3495_g6601 [Podosphaera aphanis]
MPTPLDKALNQRGGLLAFTGIIAAAAAWSIWGQEIFPRENDPTGDPKTWTREEKRRWLSARNLHPDDNDTDEQLLERVKANLRLS